MSNIFIIAKNTFNVEVRDKIIYAVFGFAILYFFLMEFMSQLVLGELPMVKSFALLGVYFFNVIVALFLGTTSFYKDIERKIVYFILSKPVSRSQFIIGKFLGLCAVILFSSVVMGIDYMFLIYVVSHTIDFLGLLAIAMQFLEMSLFIAFAMFVTTFSSSILSIVFTSAVFFIGHVVSSLLSAASSMGIGGFKLILIKLMYYILPNLEKFDIRNIAIHPVQLPFLNFFFAFCYALFYIALLLFSAILIFKKKEL
jgi:ABC-type transport system involved in multi-copper enzyme maturation permease subunit